MKKSNIFIWTYVIFLALTPIASILFPSDGILSRTCVSATIAGCFFAFSDAFQYYSKIYVQIIHTLKNQRKQYKRYSKLNKRIVKIDISRINAPKLNKKIINGKIYKVDADYFNSSLQKFTKEKKRMATLSNILAGVGFLLFLTSFAIKSIYIYFEGISESMTIYAFAVIIAMYAYREIIDSKFSRINRESKEITNILNSAESDLSTIESDSGDDSDIGKTTLPNQ